MIAKQKIVLGPERIFVGIELFLFFLKELVVANIQVAVAVVKSNTRLKPAIVKIPLSVRSDLAITILANMITLTPGTLSLDVSSDKQFLFVHVLDSDDCEATIRSIQDGFEKRLLKLYE